ncbi:MAG TPA: 2-oxo acid dehydrogenase subunit E2 [Candidatus Hydrogenedentes bacterium]|nr:2-oxo acid dehydrogenase subunit E2 [Candidatus Hydrogenedentota bacterium]HQM48715.1 2-oxo acid dehydrogenase subunit E2 [Candidatus Hydrogenedentota bacterium]
MATEFTLPELGENIESGKVTSVMVAVGDTIEKDQPVIEIETDKAALEVPSPFGGTIKEVRVKEGQDIRVGAVVLVIEEGGGAAKAKPAQARKAEEPSAAKVQQAAEPVQEEPETAEEFDELAGPDESETPAPALRQAGAGPLAASPSVRRLAREIGVDVNQVAGSGKGGRVTPEDVKAYARRMNVDAGGVAPSGPAKPAAAAASPLPDFARWGEIERREMSTVRRRTAERLAHAWATIPHVTQFDKADVTGLEELRKRYAKQVEAAGGKLTVTAVLAKVAAAALRKFPQFNTALDFEHEQLVYKQYCHIGIAVDTDRGLLVPVLRDVDTKNLTQISVELTQLAERARTKKTTLEEMQGGCFTISNLGGIGGTAFTPIINAPEVAILGVSRNVVEPVYVNGEFHARTMLPLSLSYDHRVIDGADGARFLRWICEAVENPFLLFLEG